MSGKGRLERDGRYVGRACRSASRSVGHMTCIARHSSPDGLWRIRYMSQLPARSPGLYQNAIALDGRQAT